MPHRPNIFAASRQILLLAGALTLLASACGATQDPTAVRYLDDRVQLDFGPAVTDDTPGDAGYLAWFEGRVDEATTHFEGADADRPDVAFARAELALQRGHYLRAATAHADFVETNTGHPLATLSAYRLERLRALAGPQDVTAEILENEVVWTRAGDEARLPLARLAAEHHERRALEKGEARPSWTPYGTLDQWRIVGPFTFFDAVGFETVFEPEQQPTLSETYDVDGRRLTRRASRHHGRVEPTVSTTGVYYLESFFEIDRATEAVIAMHGAAQARVWVDGEWVLDRLRSERPAHSTVRRVRLSRGRHRVLVKLGMSSLQAGFELQVVPRRAVVPFGLRNAEPRAATGTCTPGLFLRLAAGLPEDLVEVSGEPFYLWLAALIASETGDVARGRVATELGLAAVEQFAPLQIAEAELLGIDPALDPSVAVNLAIEAWRTAIEIDPKAAHARLMLGELLMQQEQPERALEQLDAAAVIAPDTYRAHYGRYLALENLGFVRPAERALREAYAAYTDSCDLAVIMLDVNASRSEFATPEDIPDAVAHCPEVSEALVRDYHLPRGETKRAIEVYRTLIDQFPARTSYKLTLAGLLARDGHLEEALATYEAAGTDPQASGTKFVQERVDLLMAHDRHDDARALLEDAMAREAANVRLIELMRQFGGGRVLSDLRKDGMEVVREYLEDKRYDAESSAFYLLDYAAFRYFPDGSQLSVTHQIKRVLNKDAKNRLGEVRVPRGAIVTVLRTIKADGETTIEPELIANKPSISMPNLEVGDFVEFEYITASGPRIEGASSFVVPRWYFQIFEAPLMYSELVVEVPADIELTFDVRGDVPDPEVTRRDGFERYRWLMTEMHDPRQEPATPTMLEIVPSIQIAHDIDKTWIVRSLRNAVRSTTVPSAYLREALELGAQGATSSAEATRRLFRFVKREITDEGEPFSQPATWVWTAGTGSRLTLLKALLDLAEIPNEVVLIKPFEAPPEESAIGDLNGYTRIAIRVELTPESRPIWLDPSQTWAKFDYLAPNLQGQPAISLGASERSYTTADYDDDIDRQRLAFDLAIETDGSISGHGSETSDGIAGTGLRNFIARFQTQPEELRTRLAQYLAPHFGRVVVSNYSFEGVEDDGPVTVGFDFEAGAFANVSDGEMEVQARVFADRLFDRFASLPSRTQTLLLASPLLTALELEISVPDGYELADVPDDVELDSRFGTYTRTVDVLDGRLRISEQLDLPKQRVAPADYTDFQAFARQVDDAQTLRFSATAESGEP